MSERPSILSKRHYLNAVTGQLRNVKNGYRSGGKAPIGYQLKYTIVGARNYTPIEKSKLVPDPNWFFIVQRYLKGRARGFSRKALIERLDLQIPYKNLTSIEFGALTYAGHTVYNRYGATMDGKYVTGKKYRPRDKWQITENTHEAMISTEEANAILNNLDTRSRTHRKNKYLLSTQLVCDCGGYIQGNANYYSCQNRCGAPSFYHEPIDDEALDNIATTCKNIQFVDRLTDVINEQLLIQKQSLERQLISEMELRSRCRDELSEWLDVQGLADSVELSDRATREISELESRYNTLSVSVDSLKTKIAHWPVSINNEDARVFVKVFFNQRYKNFEAIKALSKLVYPTLSLNDAFYRMPVIRWTF